AYRGQLESEDDGPAPRPGRTDLAQFQGLQYDGGSRPIPGREVRRSRHAKAVVSARANTQPPPRGQGWADGATEHVEPRGRALRGLRSQGHQGRRQGSRAGGPGAAAEGVRGSGPTPSQGSAPGRPYRVSLNGAFSHA